MKSNMILLPLLAVTFLSACQKNEQAPKVPAVAGRNTMQGPSDGGGGDTCNGKMIESYKVDVTELAEFKEFIQPILEKTLLQTNDKKNESPFLLTPKLKNWYLIDCKLQDIPKERKGLYLETYQTAIHTSREIFIDASSYNQMVKEEKAKLILHEMVMSYYLMKYLSLEELCKVANTCSGDFLKVSNWKLFRPEIYHPLNEEDHQKIRNVTAWLWSERTSLSPESFAKEIKNNDFDKRFELASSGTTGSKEIEVDIQSLVRMFKKYQWTHSFPQFCKYDANTNVSTSLCQTEITVEIRDYNVTPTIKTKQLYLKVKIIRDSDKKEFSQEFSYPLTDENKKVKLYMSKIGSVLSSASFALLANWPAQNLGELNEGIKSQILFLMINFNDLENPAIYQMLYQTYVWYSFEDEIVKKDGATYKMTYGYPTLVAQDSENLFIENELPFVFGSIFKSRAFIKSVILQE